MLSRLIGRQFLHSRRSSFLKMREIRAPCREGGRSPEERESFKTATKSAPRMCQKERYNSADRPSDPGDFSRAMPSKARKTSSTESTPSQARLASLGSWEYR